MNLLFSDKCNLVYKNRFSCISDFFSFRNIRKKIRKCIEEEKLDVVLDTPSDAEQGEHIFLWLTIF